MFESGAGGGAGAGGEADRVAASAPTAVAPAAVDVAFGALVGGVLAEMRDAFAQAALVEACLVGPVDQVALASALQPVAPGTALVELLHALVPGEVGDAVLVEALAGWERVISWATARQGEMVAELARRRDGARVGEFTGDEVACALVVTRAVAEAKVGLAVGLDLLPGVRDALVTGAIDHRKATALVDGVAHLDPAAAAAVLAVVLPVAPGLTVPALRAKLRRVELSVHPGAGAERAVRDRADRYVRVTPANR